MDALLLFAATALVGKKYLDERKIQQKSENESFSNETIDSLKVVVDDVPVDDEQPETVQVGGPVPTNNDFFKQLGISQNTTSGGLPFAPDNVAVEVAQKKETEDTSYFHEQYFPQDTRNTGSSTKNPLWRLAEQNAYVNPKTERLADPPTKDDVFEIDYRKKIRDFGNLHSEYTTHIAKSRNHENPVEEIWTGNGSKDGFHPKNMNQHHKFLLSDNPLFDLPNGPRGSFVGGALMSDKVDKTLSTFKRDEATEITGIATGPYFKIPFQSSFKVDPSNAEGYLIEKHIESSSRAPVNKTSTNESSSVTVAHDDNVNTFKSKLNASKMRRSKNKDSIGVKSDTKFKSAEIETPSIVGAAGGTRSLAVSKDSEIKSSSHHENLGVSASQVMNSVGAMALKKDKSFVTKPSVDQPDPRLSETESYDTKMRKTNRLEKKQIDTTEEMTFDGKKETINENLDSKNYLAPVDTNLPKYLQNKPTASVSMVKNNVQLKENESVSNFDARLGTSSKLVVHPIKHQKSSVKREMEASDNASMFGTLLSDRLGTFGRSVRPPRGHPTLVDAHFRANLEIENVN